MATFVSMVNWTGAPYPQPSQVRSAVQERDDDLRRRGLRSVSVLAGDDACTAVIVATVEDERAAARLAASIIPDATLRIDSMRFDDDPGEAGWTSDEVRPPPSRADRPEAGGGFAT